MASLKIRPSTSGAFLAEREGGSSQWRWWPLAGVVAAYLATTLVVPVLAPVAIGDDWIYARAALTLYEEQRLRILEPAAAIAVFEAAWGALAAWVFGFSFGALRASTVVLTAAGAVGVFGLATALGARRAHATVGAALFLFNPLNFVLSYTFMTDPHFLALTSLAAWCYVRGLRIDAPHERFILAGSVFSALSLLSRQQGVLLPATITFYLVVAGRLRFSMRSIRLLVYILLVPVVTALVYAVWVKFFRGVPAAQADFARNVAEAGPFGLVLLARRHAFIQPMYLGLFLLPLVPSTILGAHSVRRRLRPGAVIAAAAGSAALVGALVAFQASPRRMPYLRSYFNRVGLGPYDLLIPPAPILSDAVVEALTWLSLLGAVGALALLLTWSERSRRTSSSEAEMSDRADPANADRSSAMLVALLLVVMGAGALPQSVTFRDAVIDGANIPGLDRYLLPMLPFAIALGVGAASRLRLRWEPAAVALVPVALFAIAATRDGLVFQSTVWTEARRANAMGVANTKLDAGAAWGGHHLFEYSVEHDIDIQTPNGPWWTIIFAPATDSSYVIGTGPPPGWSVVHERAYSSWLQRQPTKMFVLRRPDVAGPP